MFVEKAYFDLERGLIWKENHLLFSYLIPYYSDLLKKEEEEEFPFQILRFHFLIFAHFLLFSLLQHLNYEFQFELLENKMTQMEEVLANIEDRDNNIYRLYFEASPIPKEQRTAGFGGVNRYRSLEGFNNSDLIIDATEKLEKLQKRLVIQSKSLDEITSLAKEKEKLLAAIPAIQPVSNEDLTRMASGYGWRSDPFTKVRKMHYGMDFTAPRGTPVYATGDGVVTRADNRSSGYGEHIRIDHGFGYMSLYGHLSKYKVRPGQKVKRGDLIGLVGSTGRSQAPHCHYEVWKDGNRINPINFYYGSLSADEYEALLHAASQENQSLD